MMALFVLFKFYVRYFKGTGHLVYCVFSSTSRSAKELL